MAEFCLQSIWRIEAPLEDVYAAVLDSLCWPDWWPGAEHVDALASGDATGIGSVRRYAWQGKLPYLLVVDVQVTRIEPLVTIEGRASGDLDGIGRWNFSRQGLVSIVCFEWRVTPTRWWMKLIAPLARPVFIRNHALIMAQGGAGLAKQLQAPLLEKCTVDLLTNAVSPMSDGLARRKEWGRVDPVMALVVGIAAGTIATAAQLVLWWLADIPLVETLLRDARLTAALLMGRSVLPPPLTAQWDILLVATLIHFVLSVAYALIPALLAERLKNGSALPVGALYGLAIYVVNLYGLTLLFPWFAVARDWITLVAHLVFGMTLFAGCRLFRQTSDSL